MDLWVAVTDGNWFRFLRERQPDEVNFWQPSAGRQSKKLTPGDLFLFKLHSPEDYVVGGGFFVRYTVLPCSLAWEAFGEKNGVSNVIEFQSRIQHYRQKSGAIPPDPEIGCNVLAEPFFLTKESWIPVPPDWKPNIVQGKTYNTDTETGASLWRELQERLARQIPENWSEDSAVAPQYGSEYLARARLGQGAFRVLVTEAYHRRCAITGERTLPVLQASHIKPYAKSGPNRVQNGLLLRSDVHILFDKGLVTVTPEMRVEVSKRIKEEYENGREYYAYHGRSLTGPDSVSEYPKKEFLSWHNENVFTP